MPKGHALSAGEIQILKNLEIYFKKERELLQRHVSVGEWENFKYIKCIE